MGNWRRVWIVGTCPHEQAIALSRALRADDLRAYMAGEPLPEDWPASHCLKIGDGLCGLPDWPNMSRIDAIGNLYERNYTPEDVRDAAERYVLPVAPGIDALIHCGGDYESDECVATVAVAQGRAELRPPTIPKLPPIPEEQIADRMRAVRGPA